MKSIRRIHKSPLVTLVKICGKHSSNEWNYEQHIKVCFSLSPLWKMKTRSEQWDFRFIWKIKFKEQSLKYHRNLVASSSAVSAVFFWVLLYFWMRLDAKFVEICSRKLGPKNQDPRVGSVGVSKLRISYQGNRADLFLTLFCSFFSLFRIRLVHIDVNKVPGFRGHLSVDLGSLVELLE